MVYIDVIKLCEDLCLYSVIITRLDMTDVVSRTYLETSLKNAEQKVLKKIDDFEMANRKVVVRWLDR